MSMTGISSTNFQDLPVQTTQSRMQQFRQEFQQLGQDLRSGNLSAAQTDFATLQQLGPLANSQGAGPISQDLNQLSQDLKGGDLSAAQQDLAKIQQDVQTQTKHVHHHQQRQVGSDIGQEFGQLGQALQAGDLAAAQQAYTRLQQDFAMFTQGNGLSGPQASPTSIRKGVSLNA